MYDYLQSGNIPLIKHAGILDACLSVLGTAATTQAIFYPQFIFFGIEGKFWTPQITDYAA